jgi:integrase
VTVGVDEHGRQIRKKATGRTKAEMETRLRELADAHDEGRQAVRRDLTVARFLEEWLADVLPGSVATGTETNYRNVVNYYVRPALGRKHLRTLQARDVTTMLRDMAADGKSPNTQRLARSVLRRALRWAEAEGMVARNVAAIADGVKVGTKEGRALTPEQARQFLTYLADTSKGEKSPPTPSRLEAAYAVAIALGLRRGELLGLAWDDLDLDATPPRLSVRRALKRHPSGLVLEEPKTRQSRRTVHLPAQVAGSLKRHRKRQAEDRLKAGELWEALPLGADLVFRTELGTSLDPDNFRAITYKLTADAGIGKWSPHALRHSAASLLLAQGVPLKVISEVLGHSSIRVTADVYAHLMEPAKAEAADAMETALWGEA